ncbi:MAG: protein kinase [Rubripirellula sp.]
MNSNKKRFGRFELIGFLGKGGMGRVYLAVDPSLDRHVALKIPHLDEDCDQKWRDMFYEEARAMAQIRHTNLCPVYEVGNVEGVDYLAMAYIKGPSLVDLVRDEKVPKTDQVMLMFGKLALGIHQMHRAGVIHRDLKPGNIIIDTSGEPVVVDFGLASRGPTDVMRDSIVGSNGFLAPEIITSNGRDVGPQSDIYALGTIGYLLLTGKMPYEGSPTKIYRAQRSRKPLLPSVIRPDLDQEIDGLLCRALEAEPTKRYGSARELALEINRLIRKQPAKGASQYRQFDLQMIQGCHVIHIHNESLLTIGELDRTKVELFKMLSEERPLQLILNFAAVPRCSSGAISVLAHLYLDLKATRTHLRLCGIRDSIRRVFTTMKLEGTVFDIVDTVPNALRAVQKDT